MAAQQRVAVLVDQGYQDLEFWYPLLRLREEGVAASVIGGAAETTYLSRLEYPVIPDLGIADAKAEDFTAVLVPGGDAGARLAGDQRMVAFIAAAARNGALLGATAEGVAALDAAGARGGRRVVTARRTDDLPEYCRALLAALAGAR
jgi:protease I